MWLTLQANSETYVRANVLEYKVLFHCVNNVQSTNINNRFMVTYIIIEYTKESVLCFKEYIEHKKSITLKKQCTEDY